MRPIAVQLAELPLELYPAAETSARRAILCRRAAAGRGPRWPLQTGVRYKYSRLWKLPNWIER